jgi:hypothetical protein
MCSNAFFSAAANTSSGAIASRTDARMIKAVCG